MAREKLKNFLTSVGGPSTTPDRITYTREADGRDLGVDPGTEKELLNLEEGGTSESLLGDWIKFLVDEYSQNTFTLKGGSEKAASSNRGNVLPSAEEQGADMPFVPTTSTPDGFNETLGSVMSTYSNSGMFPDLVDIIDKTGKDSPRMQDDPADGQPAHSGHTVLSSIKGADMGVSGETQSAYIPESTLQKSVENYIVKNSRFNQAFGDRFIPYAENPTSVSDLDSGARSAGTTTSQNEFGEYNKNAVTAINNDLKNVAKSLMIKAARFDKSTSPGESSNPNGIRYTGVHDISPVDPDVISAKNAYGAPFVQSTGKSTREGRGDLLTHSDLSATRYTRSIGSINTPYSQFSETSSQEIIIAQAAGAIAAMMGVAKEFINDVAIGGLSKRVELFDGPYILGQDKRIETLSRFQLLKRIVLTSTEYPYEACVNTGFQMLFNLSLSEAQNPPTLGSIELIDESSIVQESPGFWLSVARKILFSYSEFSTLASSILSQDGGFRSSTTSNISSILFEVSKSGIIDILNVIAITGDIALKASGGSLSSALNPTSDPVMPYNVDILPDGPATRVSKSRSRDGHTNLSLAWRGNSVPSMFMIPQNVISAPISLGTAGANGQNPLKGMLGSRLVKDTYIGADMEGSAARIPGEVVENFENILDAEYVPFYFHDLRTNEILSFHAFLTSLSDSYNPRFTSTSGYGRMDPVQTFRQTTRSVSLSFYAVSTSKQDFDEMWWKINKLTTMVYPSWTQGSKLNSQDSGTFIQPFSQVLGASPIIRLRVGDVVKGNYSRFNLARLFGIGDPGIKPQPDYSQDPFAQGVGTAMSAVAKPGLSDVHRMIFNVAFGSPLSWVGRIKNTVAQKLLYSTLSRFLVNGFANPFALLLVGNQLKDPDSSTAPLSAGQGSLGKVEAVIQGIAQGAVGSGGYHPGQTVFLKATTDYVIKLADDTSGKKWKINRALRCIVGERQTVLIETERDGKSTRSQSPKNYGQPTRKTYYKCAVIDTGAPEGLFLKEILVSHSMLFPDPSNIFNQKVLPFLSIGSAGIGFVQEVANEAAGALGVSTDILSDYLFATKEAQFMQSDFNPITRAFESTRGRGLGCVITRLGFDWLEFPWEIDHNSRAPMACKVDMSFDIIHDIAPGLDHSGFNRAPIYNVGDIMKHVAGDPHNDNGDGSRRNYTSAARSSTVSNQFRDEDD